MRIEAWMRKEWLWEWDSGWECCISPDDLNQQCTNLCVLGECWPFDTLARKQLLKYRPFPSGYHKIIILYVTGLGRTEADVLALNDHCSGFVCMFTHRLCGLIASRKLPVSMNAQPCSCLPVTCSAPRRSGAFPFAPCKQERAQPSATPRWISGQIMGAWWMQPCKHALRAAKSKVWRRYSGDEPLERFDSKIFPTLPLMLMFGFWSMLERGADYSDLCVYLALLYSSESDLDSEEQTVQCDD